MREGGKGGRGKEKKVWDELGLKRENATIISSKGAYLDEVVKGERK
jgi:hypothetical protein